MAAVTTKEVAGDIRVVVVGTKVADTAVKEDTVNKEVSNVHCCRMRG